MAYNMMDFGWMTGYGGQWFWLSALFWLLVSVALILGIYWLFKNMGSGQAGQTSASEILKQRYARGELTKKEFEEKMKDIGA